ncbi:MAG: sugar kinase [Oscillospiraceae bacterium]|nr:sugar kinase [Oscillospiraceae bacterium]MCL2279425.1 sugar kinase [Oscillospiraceae bacterium]
MQLDEKIYFGSRCNDVLAVGELLVDMVSVYDKHQSNTDSYRKFFGGSVANVAINVKKLGIKSVLASAVGKDSLGDFLVNYLKSAGICTDCVQRVDGSTSMVLTNKSSSTPTPIFYRAADYYIYYSEKLEKTVSNSKIVHFSCWPISRSPSRETIEKVLATAKANNVLVCFDPNYHRQICDNRLPEETSLKHIKSIMGMVDIIKPSEDDAERIFGKDSVHNQIEKFLNLGAKLVIMTLGKDGAIVSNGADVLRYETLATEVVNTTGAGDAFWSGFYAAAIKGYSIRDAVSLGSAASAYKLKSLSSVSELPALEQLKKLYKFDCSEVDA